MLRHGFDTGMIAGMSGLGTIIGLVILADLILLGVWLFQKVTKK